MGLVAVPLKSTLSFTLLDNPQNHILARSATQNYAASRKPTKYAYTSLPNTDMIFVLVHLSVCHGQRPQHRPLSPRVSQLPCKRLSLHSQTTNFLK